MKARAKKRAMLRGKRGERLRFAMLIRAAEVAFPSNIYRLTRRKRVVPATLEDVARQFESLFERVVGFDKVGNAEVSTVFLVIRHGWGNNPEFFETAVRGGLGGGIDIVRRYATWAEARAGHAATVEALRGKHG